MKKLVYLFGTFPSFGIIAFYGTARKTIGRRHPGFDSQGFARTVTTSSFGYYQFDDVATGANYVIGVMSKQYRFTSRLVQVADTLTDANFIGTE